MVVCGWGWSAGVWNVGDSRVQVVRCSGCGRCRLDRESYHVGVVV